MAESITVPGLWTGHCQCGDHAYEASGIPDDPHTRASTARACPARRRWLGLDSTGTP